MPQQGEDLFMCTATHHGENSPLPGWGVAEPGQWPGPQADGSYGRSHDGPCVPLTDYQDTQSLIQENLQ